MLERMMLKVCGRLHAYIKPAVESSTVGEE